jgi:hypothetical protein
MLRKSGVVLTAACLILGLIVGWFSASFIAAKDNERYTMDVLSYARYAQAQERAILVRLLENKDLQKAEEILYVVLSGNFKDYIDGANTEEREKACELLKLLGPTFVASVQETGPNQPKSRRALVESIRSATPKCGANVK